MISKEELEFLRKLVVIASKVDGVDPIVVVNTWQNLYPKLQVQDETVEGKAVGKASKKGE